ncbi:MAG: UDP-N-acetylmuramoyl-L-alanine--D-glutamate ligase [Crocinitomicaceae bacterium]|nr:UDP-N-acetylmuramoyl-L-alanine--D-glutamate ligase [Crocinitomicaceae bacterium]
MIKSLKNITVLGAGKSGIGAAVLAKKKNIEVVLFNDEPINSSTKEFLNNYRVKWIEKKYNKIDLDSDLLIKSPGIDDNHQLVKYYIDHSKPVISEIEFASYFCNAKKICVTGTNGKTTTTLMVSYILKKAGLKVKAVGNIGESYALSVALEKFDYYVIELSSFQLDRMFDFKADISILLNISPDHLDRYQGDFIKYSKSKFRINQNMTMDDHLIYNYDDQVISSWISSKNKRLHQNHPVSIYEKLEKGAWLENEQIQININKKKTTIMSIHQLANQGKHNLFNSMAAGVAARVLEIRKEIIRDSLSDFQNVEHRLEDVAKIHGINFINDSKATNVNSTWYALESMQQPTIWIVGGVDKGNDYSVLEGLVKQKVLGIVCLGKDNNKIKDAFGSIVESFFEANTAEQAVQISYRIAKKGYNVLLSPACASFDLFKDYEDRGHQFKSAVRSL